MQFSRYPICMIYLVLVGLGAKVILEEERDGAELPWVGQSDGPSYVDQCYGYGSLPQMHLQLLREMRRY